MDAQSEDEQQQQKPNENKNLPEQQQQQKPNENKTLPEQQSKYRQVQKASNEEKFTWHPGDIQVFASADDIPGFQPFSQRNKKKPDQPQIAKKEDQP